jgi:hypothetical protein
MDTRIAHIKPIPSSRLEQESPSHLFSSVSFSNSGLASSALNRIEYSNGPQDNEHESIST